MAVRLLDAGHESPEVAELVEATVRSRCSGGASPRTWRRCRSPDARRS
jgi:hypothetical protein